MDISSFQIGETAGRTQPLRQGALIYTCQWKISNARSILYSDYGIHCRNYCRTTRSWLDVLYMHPGVRFGVDPIVNPMFRTCLFFLGAALVAHASDQDNGASATASSPGVSLSDPIVQKPDGESKGNTDSGIRYLLCPRDNLKLSVQGEDINAERRIDAKGELNVPYAGRCKVAGLTVEEAQEAIAKRYREAEIFVHPEVVISVVDYSPREVVVLGQVEKSGKVSLPPEASEVSIVEAIASAGGFTRLANPRDVRVTRKDDKGDDQTITVNVSKMMDGPNGKVDVFKVQPGDVIFVPERLL